jgi:hypothetical protein
MERFHIRAANQELRAVRLNLNASLGRDATVMV